MLHLLSLLLFLNIVLHNELFQIELLCLRYLIFHKAAPCLVTTIVISFRRWHHEVLTAEDTCHDRRICSYGGSVGGANL